MKKKNLKEKPNKKITDPSINAKVARKLNSEKPVPVKMPESLVMMGIDEEINLISEKELALSKKKKTIANNLFITALVSSLIFLFIWVLAILWSPEKYQSMFMAGVAISEAALLFLLLKLFGLYSRRGHWKTHRKKSVINWMIFIFIMLFLFSLIFKL